MSRLTRDGTAEPVSRDQILRHARGQGNVHFPCSADHEQDWQPYTVDPYSAICDDHTYIHTYILTLSPRKSTASPAVWGRSPTIICTTHAVINIPASSSRLIVIALVSLVYAFRLSSAVSLASRVCLQNIFNSGQ